MRLVDEQNRRLRELVAVFFFIEQPERNTILLLRHPTNQQLDLQLPMAVNPHP